jgi:putative hydrolase of the HAD superfamily
VPRNISRFVRDSRSINLFRFPPVGYRWQARTQQKDKNSIFAINWRYHEVDGDAGRPGVDSVGRVKAVIFDIYNTLLDNDTDEKRQDTYRFLSLWLSYHGVRIDAADLRSLYLEICNDEISKSNEPYPDIDIRTVFSGIITARGGPDPPPEAMVAEMALLFRILTTNHLYPFPGVIAMLDALKGKAILGIASNAQRLFTIPELGKFGLIDYFDAMVFSSDLGIAKPSPMIFSEALKTLSVAPEAAVYVGDNLVADIAGAQQVGMKAIWINRAGQDHVKSGIEPDFIVPEEVALTEMLLSMLHEKERAS